ncbi:NAD-dependent epimerase/dehydratase family protein [Aquibium sp. A9E412]|uniref:vitamin K epoxide reductase family protein n=1 Tax=Aquibium sp. A9E412 TaxID=2976767 RepID=UPI0025B08CE4|nr:vitamin K epoxide reductase family protein [Aquibium sp. A9E412]MDN2566099.1 NAD-dependent epimerase/dehydratase family protein [Aquibium sp. A9E412]
MARPQKPIVLITGAAGNIGGHLADALSDAYHVVGLDMPGKTSPHPLIEIDITSDDSVALALTKFAQGYGKSIAAVVHLAAYFDFTGEESPLYEAVNIEGTRRLLRALQDFEVGRFIYSGTMLVHRAGTPGTRIDETTPVEPQWAYPQSKAAAEAAIRAEHGHIPYLLLHLAGLYSEAAAVPTLSHQIARIYERDIKSRLYSGDLRSGQSFIHQDDLMDLFRRAVDRRDELPDDCVILAGEPEAVSYATLQDRIGELIHGRDAWYTISVPKPVAKAGAWVEEKSEPIVPDDFDQGEKPFIRPFMIDMADDHYALDVSRARRLLGWEPRHAILDTLPAMIAALKRDPLAWYQRNGITPPDWMNRAAEHAVNPEAVRRRHESHYHSEHKRNLWAHFAVAGLGTWLLTSPATLGYGGTPLAASDYASGAALLVLGMLSLSWRLAAARFAAAAVGLWLLAAPLVFWTGSASGYLNSTLVGTFVIAFAMMLPPIPGVAAVAAETGPSVPVGWSYNPSAWLQRLPIILLAFVGLYFSRYLAAYQLGHIDGVWEPFFPGTVAGKNGTEDVITSRVSEAWPVPDAGLGAATYILEILTGALGSRARWRTMPWLVLAFGVMIVPLGIVSITFIIIQPIVIGTWCTLCLIGAAAMLVQIPYSLDELVATIQFLARRRRAGAPLLRIFFTGDTDTESGLRDPESFERHPGAIVREMVAGGLSVPWNLGLCLAIGVWLMFTRLTLGTDGAMADADHLIGALVVTVTVIAFAEVARPLRLLNVGFGLALTITPFVLDTTLLATGASLVAGVLLIGLSLRRGPVRAKWGGLERYAV